MNWKFCKHKKVLYNILSYDTNIFDKWVINLIFWNVKINKDYELNEDLEEYEILEDLYNIFY